MVGGCAMDVLHDTWCTLCHWSVASVQDECQGQCQLKKLDNEFVIWYSVKWNENMNIKWMVQWYILTILQTVIAVMQSDHYGVGIDVYLNIPSGSKLWPEHDLGTVLSSKSPPRLVKTNWTNLFQNCPGSFDFCWFCSWF